MKICRNCGVEIIDGKNGCTFSGDICFSCQPPPRYPKPAPRNFPPLSVTFPDAEDAILERQEEAELWEDGCEDALWRGYERDCRRSFGYADRVS